MALKIHHLDAATMCPLGARLLGAEGGLLGTATLVGHVWLIESDRGLVLVDTGFGTADCAEPSRLGRPFTALVRPQLDPARTARAQIEALGYRAADVRHVVVTHLDLDHAGGLGDFPDADVHVLRDELSAAQAGRLRDRTRYKAAHFAHGPRWVPHEGDGEPWYGFPAVRAPIPGLDDVLMIALPGHSRGHAAVAARRPQGWLLHCGDGYFHHRELDPDRPECPVGLRVFQRLMDDDHARRVANQQRLRELVREHGHEVRPVSAHDPEELRRCREAARS